MHYLYILACLRKEQRWFSINIVEYSKHTLTLIFLLLLYLAYLLVKPLLLTVVTAILLAYLFYPVYSYLNKRLISNRYVCSFLVLVLIFLVVSLPTFFVLKSVTQEGLDAYVFLRDYVSEPGLLDCTNSDNVVCSVYDRFFTESDAAVLTTIVQDAVVTVGKTVWSQVYNIFISLPSKIFDVIIMVFLVFFLFVDGQRLLETIKHLLPMKIEHEKFIVKTLKDTTDAIVYGQTFTAVLQGFVAGVGFWLLGVPHALLLGVIVAFLAIIPFIGGTAVYIPVGLYYILAGLNATDNALLIKGGLVIAYGVLFISSIDNLLKPKIIGDKAKLHPVLVMIGVIGGMSLFGLVGFFLGPIIFGLFQSMLHIYRKEKKRQLRKR